MILISHIKILYHPCRVRKRHPYQREKYSRFNSRRRTDDYFDDDNYDQFERRPNRGRHTHNRSDDLW